MIQTACGHIPAWNGSGPAGPGQEARTEEKEPELGEPGLPGCAPTARSRRVAREAGLASSRTQRWDGKGRWTDSIPFKRGELRFKVGAAAAGFRETPHFARSLREKLEERQGRGQVIRALTLGDSGTPILFLFMWPVSRQSNLLWRKNF